MGQMTFGLMLGCKMPEPSRGKAWYGESVKVGEKLVYQDGLLDMFKPGRGGMKPQTDEEANVVGLYVAIGAGGMSGVPDLEGPIDLATAATDKRYAKAIARAQEAWARFSVFCGEHGVTLTEPRLWLVETEVA